MVCQSRKIAVVLLRAAVATSSLTFASAQSFQIASGQIPVNGGFTENVDFADVDGDGDRDCLLAEGGDGGNDQNNLWINKGFEPGGTIGFFADRTATQYPAVLDDSRDVDFVDIDGDGDFDVYVSNTSTSSSQSNRWIINMGGAQGGTPGFFSDQTPARWTFLGVNNGTTHFSSIAPSAVLGSGGFVDWSCDCVLGDLNNDGHIDLFHSTYGGTFAGQVPSRIFLNNGLGQVEEFNPSHVQLGGTTIGNGTAALWAEGVQTNGTTNTSGLQADISDTPLGAELGDLDGDMDIDVLQGARNEIPRTYRNRLTDTGNFVAWRDVTFISGYTAINFGGGNYEQELGDFDNDDDLDLYGLNWPGFDDCTMRNNGSGVFGNLFTLANSGNDDNEGDFFDYDNDGRLDIFVSAFAGQDRLYRNDGPPNWTHSDVTGAQLPNSFGTALGADSCDVDLDGDYDVLVANDGGGAEMFLKNITQIGDTTAPRPAHLEQAPNRFPSTAPTAIRVHVYDNSSWDVSRYDATVLEYSTNGGGSWTPVSMIFAGGQMFRGEIPGSVTGTIDYRVRSTDEHGNIGTSPTKTFLSGCGATVAYCTAGTTTHGCNAAMSGSGMPSATAASGFTLTASSVEGQKQGLIFYGITGRNGAIWAPGNTSFLCVKSPVQRTVTQNSGGTVSTCTGAISIDWNTFMSSNPGALGQPLSVGQIIDAQAWFRDPTASGTTNLSNGIEFSVCP